MQFPLSLIQLCKCDPNSYLQDSENDNMKQPNKKIFLGGIGESIEEDDLKNYFSQYGKVEQVVIPTDKEKKQRRGFAFVVFDNTDDVDKICGKLNLMTSISLGLIELCI